jgi:hypothetical protein
MRIRGRRWRLHARIILSVGEIFLSVALSVVEALRHDCDNVWNYLSFSVICSGYFRNILVGKKARDIFISASTVEHVT